MSWTDPITWVFRQVLSATLLNQQIRDNMDYLKSPPLEVAELGSSNQTGISTTWVKVTNSDLTITLPVNGVLEFAWRITFAHSVANNHVAIDIFDVDNSIYLSSGTATPATGGLQRTAGVSTLLTQIAGSYLHSGVIAGTHNYEFRMLAQAASATLHNASVKNTVWVKEVG